MYRVQAIIRRIIFVLVFVMMSVSVSTALAARTEINVSAVWRPGVQLTSAAGDPRYVDVEIFVQGNVQFWAVDFVCTVEETILGEYAVDPAPGDIGDDLPMVRWGQAAWGTEEADFFAFPADDNYNNTTDNGFDPTTGELSFAATRLGNQKPLGLNGVDYTLLLATLRFRVAEVELTKPASSDFKCKMQFLDRDGKSVVRPKMTRMAKLSVLSGYTVDGTATYQGTKFSEGIGVECTGPEAVSTVTDSKGRFSFTTRMLGTFDCLFFGNITDPAVGRQADVFLAGKTIFDLNSNSFNLLPVTLKGGNANQTGGNETIDLSDIAELTMPGRWDSSQPSYTQGDINGDGKVNELDLAIVGGNFALTEEVDYSHIIYGLARDFEDKVFPVPNSRVWWGDPMAGAVSELVTSKTPDFWPVMSPDGSSVALSRYDSRGNHYELYVVDAVKFPRGKATRVTPRSYTLDVFAPSWSPDGQRIAFICSERSLIRGWEFNEGSVCVIDADGRNLHQIGNSSKIFPPAWFNDTVLIYAGHPGDGLSIPANSECPNDLCFYDFLTGTTDGVFDNLATGLNSADMPVIQTYGADTYLFYRFDDTATKKLRVAKITYDGTSFGGGIVDTVPSALHKNVAVTVDGTPISNDVDYYDVSPQLNIIFYETGDSLFQNSIYSNTFGQWSDPLDAQHFVDGYVGPASASSELDPTHALRATADWIP